MTAGGRHRSQLGPSGGAGRQFTIAPPAGSGGCRDKYDKRRGRKKQAMKNGWWAETGEIS